MSGLIVLYAGAGYLVVLAGVLSLCRAAAIGDARAARRADELACRRARCRHTGAASPMTVRNSVRRVRTP